MAKRLIGFLDCLIWPIISIYGITSGVSTAMSLFCLGIIGRILKQMGPCFVVSWLCYWNRKYLEISKNSCK